ncbi:MAG: 30S ribosomal protein S13 [Candidatus Babeliales bacterium]
MARIEGVVLPEKKRVEYGLTYLYGIGLTSSRDILKKCGISLDIRVKDLSNEQIAAIQEEISGNYKIEGSLRREVIDNIENQKRIKSFRGSRHKASLPIKGRTKSNARTRKGNGTPVAFGRKVTKK